MNRHDITLAYGMPAHAAKTVAAANNANDTFKKGKFK